MLLVMEKVIILKSINLFSEISESDLLMLATQVKEVEYPQGLEVIRQGELGTSMYIIVRGKVDAIINDHVVATLSQGEVFGELSALDPEPRSATIVTKEETLLFEIENFVIENLMYEYPDVASGIIKILCQRIRNH